MCLIRVKEEDDYSVPARVVRRERRRSPPRTTRVSRAYYEEPSRSVERTYVIQQPPPPPALIEPEPYHPPSHAPSPPPPPPSHHGSRGAQYVEVSPASDSSSTSSSSESSSDDVRSKTTSRSKSTVPRSEFHLQEKEYLRERAYGGGHDYPPRRDDYDTYRYVKPPRDPSRQRSGSLGPRGSHVDDPRASRHSYKRERFVVVDDDGRRTREYRR